jgi:predicted DNA-binding transcriptional regulator YafY
MDRTERFYRIDQLLDSGTRSFAELRKALPVSRATLKRDLEYMRNRLNAPIEYDREANGYRFGAPRSGPRYELPGLWFSAARDNWYVDAYCHLRQGLRSFSVDAMEEAQLLEAKAKEIPKGELDEYLKSGYGIFSGRGVTWAKLRFSSKAARWVAKQTWHGKQRVAEALAEAARQYG